MWASSQPRENEQCLLRGAQNSLSQWNVPATQAEGNFHFFSEPWWEPCWQGKRGGEEARCGAQGWPEAWGWLYFGWPPEPLLYMPLSSLNSHFPGWLACWSVATNAWLLFREVSWDVERRELGRAEARASQEDRGAGFALPRH